MYYSNYYLMGLQLPWAQTKTINGPLLPALLLARQPNLLPLAPRHVHPFLHRNPPNVCPVPKSPNPVYILHNQPHPVALMDIVPRQPESRIGMGFQKALPQLLRRDLCFRYLLQVAQECETRQVRGGIAYIPIVLLGREQRGFDARARRVWRGPLH